MKNLVLFILLSINYSLLGQSEISPLDSSLKVLVGDDLERSTEYINHFKVYVLDAIEVKGGLIAFNFFPIYNSDQFDLLVNSVHYKLVSGKPVILVNREIVKNIDFSQYGFENLTTPKAIEFAQMLYPIVLGEISNKAVPISFEAMLSTDSH